MFETPNDIVLVMEYVPGGELYNLIERQGRMPEPEARKFFQEILSAVHYCHLHKVVHRDIKPENILLDEDTNIKISDFGLSSMLRDGEFLKTACGSPNYAAPELISGSAYCGPEVDIWSIGVVLYALLAGYLPFDEGNIPALFSKIKSASYEMPHHISPLAKDLISRMLAADPVARITAKQIQEHPWYKMHLPLHLRYTPTIVDHYKDVNSISEIRAEKSGLDLDDEIVQELMELPEFKGMYEKSSIIDSLKSQKVNLVNVSYELLRDTKMKMKRNLLDSTHMKVNPVFRSLMPPEVERDSKNSFEKTVLVPNNWVYGFRCCVDSCNLMINLFDALRQSGLEWRLLSNFSVRARTLGFVDQAKKVKSQVKTNPSLLERHVKFQVNIHKYEETYILDFCQVYGQVMVFMEICEKIYKYFYLVPKFLKQTSGLTR